MDPMSIAALATQGIKSAVGLGQAIVGGIRSKKLAKQEPKYSIPTEVDQGLNMATRMAQTGMASQQYNNAITQNQQSANFALRGAQDRRGGLMAASNIQANLDRANAGVASQDAQMRQQNQRFLYGALMNKASYRDKLFANQWQSWSNKYQQARALVGAGMQNIVGGADGAAVVLSMQGQNGGNQSLNQVSLMNPGYGMNDAQLSGIQSSMRNLRTSGI